RGVAFVVILRVAILALGPGSRGGCLPLAQRAAPRARANVLVRDLRPMIRPVLTEVALFLAPFLVYAVFLWATQAGVLHPNSWSLPRVAWLVIAALVLMIGSSSCWRSGAARSWARPTFRPISRTANSCRARRSDASAAPARCRMAARGAAARPSRRARG